MSYLIKRKSYNRSKLNIKNVPNIPRNLPARIPLRQYSNGLISSSDILNLTLYTVNIFLCQSLQKDRYKKVLVVLFYVGSFITTNIYMYRHIHIYMYII